MSDNFTELADNITKFLPPSGWSANVPPLWRGEFRIFDLPAGALVFFTIGALTFGAGLAIILGSKTKHKIPHTKKGAKKRYYTTDQWLLRSLALKIKGLLRRKNDTR